MLAMHAKVYIVDYRLVVQYCGCGVFCKFLNVSTLNISMFALVLTSVCWVCMCSSGLFLLCVYIFELIVV